MPPLDCEAQSVSAHTPATTAFLWDACRQLMQEPTHATPRGPHGFPSREPLDPINGWQMALEANAAVPRADTAGFSHGHPRLEPSSSGPRLRQHALSAPMRNAGFVTNAFPGSLHMPSVPHTGNVWVGSDATTAYRDDATNATTDARWRKLTHDLHQRNHGVPSFGVDEVPLISSSYAVSPPTATFRSNSQTSTPPPRPSPPLTPPENVYAPCAQPFSSSSSMLAVPRLAMAGLAATRRGPPSPPSAPSPPSPTPPPPAPFVAPPPSHGFTGQSLDVSFVAQLLPLLQHIINLPAPPPPTQQQPVAPPFAPHVASTSIPRPNTTPWAHVGSTGAAHGSSNHTTARTAPSHHHRHPQPTTRSQHTRTTVAGSIASQSPHMDGSVAKRESGTPLATARFPGDRSAAPFSNTYARPTPHCQSPQVPFNPMPLAHPHPAGVYAMTVHQPAAALPPPLVAAAELLSSVGGLEELLCGLLNLVRAGNATPPNADPSRHTKGAGCFPPSAHTSTHNSTYGPPHINRHPQAVAPHDCKSQPTQLDMREFATPFSVKTQHAAQQPAHHASRSIVSIPCPSGSDSEPHSLSTHSGSSHSSISVPTPAVASSPQGAIAVVDPPSLVQSAAVPPQPCGHVNTWRRLRNKKGLGHYVCTVCSTRWKMRCVGVPVRPPQQPADPESSPTVTP